MQKFDKVPVYILSREVLLNIHILSNKFSKSYKFTLGKTLREKALILTELIFSNLQNHKNKEDIFKMICICNSLYLNLRIALDLNLIFKKEYLDSITKIEKLENNLKRWQNSTV